MSLWKKIQNNSSMFSEVQMQYNINQTNGTGIPLVVRHVFAQFIENNICEIRFSTANGVLNPEHRDDIAKVQKFLWDLATEIDAWIANPHNANSVCFNEISQASMAFKNNISHDFLRMFVTIRDQINFEFAQFLNDQPNMEAVLTFNPNFALIEQKLRLVSIKSREFRDQNSEQILLQLQALINQIIDYLSQTHAKCMEEISVWKLQEQRQAIGITPHNNTLISIQNLQSTAVQLFKYLCTLFNEARDIENRAIGMSSNMSQYVDKIRHLIDELILHTFLVTKQPKWVVKTKDSKVAMSVCHLLGQHLFPDCRVQTKVKVSMINEDQAKVLYKHGRSALSTLEKDSVSLCKFGDPIKILEFDPLTNQIVARFDEAVLKTVNRGQKKGNGQNHFVMEDKFCFLFTTTLNMYGRPLQIWTTSLPVTVSSHKNQNIMGAAVIIWDYATGQLNREPFKVAIHLKWDEVASILKAVFRNELKLESGEPGLNDQHLECLKKKAFSNLKRDEQEMFTQTDEITFAELTRRKFGLESGGSASPDALKGFSFWDWFYMAIKLLQIKPHRDMWVKNLIIGFIERTKAESYIIDQPEGTFLIRFPDSIRAAFSITCHIFHEEMVKVQSFVPITQKELEFTSLADSLNSLPRLQNLFPSGAPKDTVFNEFYTTISSSSNTITPYHKRVIALCDPQNTSSSPATTVGASSPSYPSSPSSSFQAASATFSFAPVSLQTRMPKVPEPLQLLPSFSTIKTPASYAYQYENQPGLNNYYSPIINGAAVQMETDGESRTNSVYSPLEYTDLQVPDVLLNMKL